MVSFYLIFLFIEMSMRDVLVRDLIKFEGKKGMFLKYWLGFGVVRRWYLGVVGLMV